MKAIRRFFDRQKKNRRKSFLQGRGKRLLHAETLEGRALMAGDLDLGEGEGPPVIHYTIQAVQQGTNTPLSTIPEGGFFEVRVLGRDTQLDKYNTTDPSPRPASPRFPVALFTDLFFDTAQAVVQVNEHQNFTIQGSPTNNTTKFTLTLNVIRNGVPATRTTAAITYSSNPGTTINNIRTALLALDIGRVGGVASGLPNFEVSFLGSNTFQVRYLNELSNVNQAELSGTLTVPAGASSITVAEAISGDPSNPAAFFAALRPGFTDLGDTDGNPGTPNEVIVYSDGRRGGAMAFGINDVGGINITSPSQQNLSFEFLRFRVNAIDGKPYPVTFLGAADTLDYQANPPAVSGFNVPVTPDRITFDAFPTVFITEKVSAVDDAGSVNEDNAAGVTITVTSNDTSNLSPPKTPLAIDSFIAPPASVGTVTQIGTTQLKFVPAPNFSGTATFTYTVRDTSSPANKDTATVTVTVNAVNDAPVNVIPAAQVVGEDSFLLFNTTNNNLISVSDVDAGSANIRLTLTATNGVLQLGSTAGLATVSGDNTANVVITGSQANINNAINGLRYTPTPNYPAAITGPASITVLTEDLGNTGGGNLSDSDVINITVNGVNDGPVNLFNGTQTFPAQTIDEGQTITFNAVASKLITVSDVDAASVTTTLSTNVADGGTITVTTGGGAVITNNGSRNVQITGTVAQVNAALNGMTYFSASPVNDTLMMVTSDGGSAGTGGPLSDTDTMSITVLATTRPRAINDTMSGNEGGPINMDVLFNDLAHADETKELTGTFSQPPAGQGVITQVGNQLQWNPSPGNENFFGTVTFTYQMRETDVGAPGDNNGPSTATVTLTVNNVNDAPVANPDSGPTYTINEDNPLVLAAPGVLGNDTDVDNTPAQLSAVIDSVMPASEGTVVLNANGGFTFTPASNFNGTTQFTYHVNDGNANSNVTTVTIVVNAVNDAPVADNDSYTTAEEQPLAIPAPGVLDGDTDAENSPLTAAIVPGSEVGGTVTLNSDGSFLFTPALNFTGNGGFRYKANDGSLDSNEATVTINVTNVNDAPTADNDGPYTVSEGSVLNVAASPNGLLIGDTDVDNDPLSVHNPGSISLVPPTAGTLSVNANGSFTFTPAANMGGTTATFTYQATDGNLQSAPATVTINIVEFNDPPVASPDSYTTNEDTALNTAADNPTPDTIKNVLFNDTDEETPTGLTAELVTNVPAAHGTLSLQSNGEFTFTPALNFNGQTTFVYRAFDGEKHSANTTVTINVNAVNDAPTANPDNFTAVKNIANQLVTPNPKNNDTDVENSPLTIVALGSSGSATTITTANGATVRLVGGEVFYDAHATFVGTDTFDYQVSDGGLTSVGTVTVNVIDFVPKSVRGTVYIENNKTANYQAADLELAQVSIRLNGTDFQDQNVDLLVQTDVNGNYEFTNLKPPKAGTVYRITEVELPLGQPKHLRDGGEFETSPLASDGGLNTIHVAWDPQDQSGDINGLNFAELGVDTSNQRRLNTSGLKREATSNKNGVVLDIEQNGGLTNWTYSLDGWSNLKKAEFTLDANRRSGILTVTDQAGQVHVRRIHSSYTRNTGTGSPLSPPKGSRAFFRILAYNRSTGEYIIRLDGTAAQFGLNLAAASAVPQGEGEGSPALADLVFAEAADEVIRQGKWRRDN